eukprot:1628219-Pyramimonas_sp.AAC.2
MEQDPLGNHQQILVKSCIIGGSGFMTYGRFWVANPEGAGFAQEDGKGVGERKFNTPKFVDTFYNLITDFYEYGW